MKFNITVTRTDEYEIDIDENIWTPEEIKSWASVFYDANSPEDIAKHFAISFMRNDNSYHIEGFGYVPELRKDGTVKSVPYRDENGKYCELPEEKFTKGLTIYPITKDEDYETEVKTLTCNTTS